VQRWLWPSGQWLPLGTVHIEDRPHYFDVPSFAQPVEASFSDLVHLLGYDLQPRDIGPGDRLALTLYWKALGRMDTSYTVFVHLIDDDGQIRAQRDAVPGQGDLPTTGWLEGEIVSDTYALDLDAGLPDGEYTLLVGLYDAATGARLPVLPSRTDHIRLTELQLSHGDLQ
jgi:hypothetical protein